MNRRIREVYLDLDDTLNSLTLYILGHLRGLNIGVYDYDQFPIEAGYNIELAYRLLRDREKVPSLYPDYTTQEFWDGVTEDIWATVPKSKEYDFLMRTCIDLVGKENIYILTSPTKSPECYSGKARWIYSMLPGWLQRQHFIGSHKQRLAWDGALLVDDADHNVDAFRGAGGNAILIPRPWNTLHATDTKQHLAGEFYSLFSEIIG